MKNKAREDYERRGYNHTMLWSDSQYLSLLTDSAISEIESISSHRNAGSSIESADLTSVEEFKDFLREYNRESIPPNIINALAKSFRPVARTYDELESKLEALSKSISDLNGNDKKLFEISDFFYRASGIFKSYSRFPSY